ncbi:unnamed protein product [Cylicocyclus nassatus]|uniref:Uncharacterized protein n=1 Tax=Cylicocyclus nassatus TaxID=53992 RepID=A0AA36DIG2_CYLNA|nr:unnamed protein product [Cylicocyclus nassatus]
MRNDINGDLLIDAKDESQACPAIVRKRTYIPPGASKVVTVSYMQGSPACMFCSNSEKIPDGVCEQSAEGETRIPVTNESSEPMVLQKGQAIGEFEKGDWVDSKEAENAGSNESTSKKRQAAKTFAAPG